MLLSGKSLQPKSMQGFRFRDGISHQDHRFAVDDAENQSRQGDSPGSMPARSEEPAVSVGPAGFSPGPSDPGGQGRFLSVLTENIDPN